MANMTVPAMPYAPPYAYGPEGNSRITDLILRQGEIQAQAAREQAAIRGRAVENLGQIVGQTVGDLMQQREAKKKESARTAAISGFMDNWDGDPQLLLRGMVKILGPEQGIKAAEGILSFQKVAQAGQNADFEDFRRTVGGIRAMGKEYVAQNWPGMRQALMPGMQKFFGLTPDQVPETLEPQIWHVVEQLDGRWNPRGEQSKLITTTGPDGKPVQKLATEDELRQGLPVYEKPDPGHVVTTTDANGRPVTRMASPDELAKGVSVYQKPEAPQKDNEPLVPVIGPDGQSILVPRSQAVGKRPANAREQGRPVVSGDANRIADLDSSLDDLNVLASTLTGNKATGWKAQAGALTPKWFTDITGIGEGAKIKQADIDRVKQVIGKALEEGVLRKEDEIKYEKILPTIGDTPKVVQAKLKGLWQAVIRKRQAKLDALSDAGYDVTKYNERGPRQPAGQSQQPKPTSEDELLKRYGY